MALGNCIIDGTDIGRLGMFIAKGGSDDILTLPERMTPDQNDWAEHDGLDVDLTDWRFAEKRVCIGYTLVAPTEEAFKKHLNSFETLHDKPGYRQIFIREFSKTFDLRFVGIEGYEHSGGLAKDRVKVGKIKVSYQMDNPMQLFDERYTTPVGGERYETHITLNDTDLSRYGIIVEEVYNSALSPRAPKPVLTYRSGDRYWADIEHTPKKKAVEIVLSCAMLAPTIEQFWVNYSALFNTLYTGTGITVGTRYCQYKCYYKKMTDFEKLRPFSKGVAVRFKLMLQEYETI